MVVSVYYDLNDEFQLCIYKYFRVIKKAKMSILLYNEAVQTTFLLFYYQTAILHQCVARH